MASSTVTSKGQITIPVEVRTRLGLHAGSRVAFVESAEGVYELRPDTRSVRDLKGFLHWDGPAKTLQEMDAGVAEGAAESMR